MLVFQVTLLLLSLLVTPFVCQLTHDVLCGYLDTACECDREAEVCKFYLNLEQRQTFTRYKQGSSQGRLYYINDDGDLVPLQEKGICAPSENCTDPITTDGRAYRSVITINGQFPGPTLIVHENQTVLVDVRNNLVGETTSMHWHGLHQINTPWMDGVASVTQCPFGPGKAFRYIFKAFPSGTFWYHAHMGVQRTDGAFGGLVIKEKNLNYSIYFEDLPHQHTISLLDWQKVPSFDVFGQVLAATGFFPGTPIDRIPTTSSHRFNKTISMDGVEVGFIPYWSGLINGKGRHSDVPYHKSRLHIFEVQQGKTYRFRLIGAQGLYAYKFSIDGHKLTMMATDGYITQPVEVDYIIVHTAERYDFLLEASQTKQSNFWVRAETLEIDWESNNEAPYSSLNHTAEAILHYSGTPPPTSLQYQSIVEIPKTCTENSPCKAMNCPFEGFHESYHTECINVHKLRLFTPTPSWDLPSATPDEHQEYFFNLGRTTINGRNGVFPALSLQTQQDELPDREPLFCRQEKCDYDNKCYCIHIQDIPYDKTVRFVLSAVGLKSRFSHPMHLHGHHFHVVAAGYGKYDSQTGFLTENSQDITCSPGGRNPDIIVFNKTSPTYLPIDPEKEYYCSNDITWSNSVPYTFTIDPYTVRKDTVVVPAGGYVVVHFLSNNPGFWLMHCHIEAHLQTGMSLMVNEAQERQNPGPSGMPTCGDFTWTVNDSE